MIVRKYTNYCHQIYKKDHPEIVSASEIIKANPLLKFRTVLSGRQLFARDMHDEIAAALKQHVIDTDTNEAAAYQTVLKTMWDGLDADEKVEWEAKAEEECGDVAINQEEFHTIIHQALRGLCQSGVVGDAEMLLFSRAGNWGPEGWNADLIERIHGHSKHNKINFGGNELEQTYGVPWAKFADDVIPRPVVEAAGSISIIVNGDGVVKFPSINLDTVPPLELRHLLQEYFDQCRMHSNSPPLPIPWDQVISEPSKFYDTEKFVFPLALKDPQTFTIFETLSIVEFAVANSMGPSYFGTIQGEKSEVPAPPPSPQANTRPTTPSPSQQSPQSSPSRTFPNTPIASSASTVREGKRSKGREQTSEVTKMSLSTCITINTEPIEVQRTKALEKEEALRNRVHIWHLSRLHIDRTVTFFRQAQTLLTSPRRSTRRAPAQAGPSNLNPKKMGGKADKKSTKKQKYKEAGNNSRGWEILSESGSDNEEH
ncbi:hypothetical protein B0H13DRAFT_1896706 [Mycena leptocephala]|nr:hypothetical protein B0H13DRAFT_1896706 [Mycena leptocephala]